jgi:hypothetical protein
MLCLQFYFEAKTAKYWLNYWRRQRLVWWRKFANVPSNFTSYDVQQKSQVDCVTENQVLNYQTRINWYSFFVGEGVLSAFIRRKLLAVLWQLQVCEYNQTISLDICFSIQHPTYIIKPASTKGIESTGYLFCKVIPSIRA